MTLLTGMRRGRKILNAGSDKAPHWEISKQKNKFKEGCWQAIDLI